ncbi:Npt1/Npt2 family nucleotide transporter [Candidatus Uabimicrobium sp. HlEnr_7]|uniref:Npt1/Npt2 family nucleotide transporter n=1 Tax=Candidatus Uabimicrobium helgolandensis TaxID=3095367 RepID=UPI003558C06D
MSNTSSRSLWRTFIASLSFFFLIGSYYVLKPTRKPLLFTYVGKEYLHHFYNISVVVTLFAVVGYNRLVNRFSRTQLLRTLYAIVISVFLCFALLLQSLGNQPTYDATMTTLYFFFVSLYVLFVTALFWSISHDLHKNQEAKKFYPYIFLGGQLGVIGGSKFTSTFIEGNNYQLLLLIAAAGLGIAWLLIELFYIPNNSNKKDYAKPTPTGTLEDFQLFFKNRYVMFIGLVMVLATFTSTVSDQQFSWLVDNSILEDSAFYSVERSDMGNEKSFISTLISKKDSTSQKIYSSLSQKVKKDLEVNRNISKELIGELNAILNSENLVDKNSPVLFSMLNEKLSQPSTFLGKMFHNEKDQIQKHRFMVNKLFLSNIYPANFLVITPKMIRDTQFVKILKEKNTPLTNYINSFFDKKTQDLINTYDKADTKTAKTIHYKICYNLNNAIQKLSFYKESVFALAPANSDINKNFIAFSKKKFHKIKLSKRISKELEKSKITTKQRIIINKLIFEESFPQIVNTQSSLQGKIWANNNLYMGICNILMCIIITPILINVLGPAIGICLYPLVLFIGAIFFIQELSVYTVRYFAIIALSLNYTLYKVGSEIFYIPTNKNVKYKAKAVCDTFIFRLGDSGSSLMVTIYLLFLGMNGVEYSLTNLSYVVFFVVIIWIMVILKTGKLYQNLLKKTEVNNG